MIGALLAILIKLMKNGRSIFFSKILGILLKNKKRGFHNSFLNSKKPSSLRKPLQLTN